MSEYYMIIAWERSGLIIDFDMSHYWQRPATGRCVKNYLQMVENTAAKILSCHSHVY